MARTPGQLFKKSVPQMPEGYYSGDKPNPNLRSFVEQHIKENPYDPANEKYDVPAFDKPIETTKATAIYNMHTYWSKKPHDAIREYIRHYTKPGDLVLDPFCGSGGTALAALMEGRKAIAIDRSPAATFITKNYCTPVDVDELQAAFEELKRKVKPEIDKLYETKCDRCGGKAATAHTVYSQVFQCPRCLEKVPLFDCMDAEKETKAGKAKKISACPHCFKRGMIEEISTRSEKFGAIPVLVSYSCENGCKPKRNERQHTDPSSQKREFFEKYDLAKIRDIESKEIPYWYPPQKMMNVEDDTVPWGVEWRQGRNFRSVAELFTRRNLTALAILKANIEELSCNDALKGWLKFAMSGILLGMSRMNQYRPDVSFPLNIMSGTYYLPQVSKEEYLWTHYENKVERLEKGIRAIRAEKPAHELCISTSNSAGNGLSGISANSVDYIFTDPPYGGKYQYGELNFIWEAWLGFDTHWHEEEIIVNELRGKTETDWADMMRKAMAGCYRVLKPGRWLSLCYHDTSEGTWGLIQDIMAESGFVADTAESAVFIDTGGLTYNQTQADKVTRRDLVINYRKPQPGQVALDIVFTGSEDKLTFAQKAHVLIRNYLEAYPGQTIDRIYDEVVSRMVRKGQMQPHDFETLLREVADEIKQPIRKNLLENEPANIFGTHEVGCWYLKDIEPMSADVAQAAKEDTAAESLTKFMKAYLKKHIGAEGVHYSDLFEHYIYAVKDKPRRQLADWLLDYFYKTDDGTYRLPASPDEEQLKADGRKQGTNRRVKRYLAYLEQGVAVPEKERPSDASLAEWIRSCRRSGMYLQGKLLFEKGGLNKSALTEELQAKVEEDYETCARYVARAAETEAKPSRRKRSEDSQLELDE